VAAGELVEADGLAAFQSQQHRMVAHELTDVDVVPGVDRRERRSDGQATAGEDLALRRGLAARADSFLRSGHDHFEVSVAQRPGRDEALARDHQSGIGVVGDRGGVVVKTNPGRGHGIGVDVVEQVLGANLAGAQRELAGELTGDALGIFGEVENSLSRGQRKAASWHRAWVYHD
jgi:hypothetical protein